LRSREIWAVALMLTPDPGFQGNIFQAHLERVLAQGVALRGNRRRSRMVQRDGVGVAHAGDGVRLAAHLQLVAQHGAVKDEG
jgi:hypothetical protein